MAWLTSSATLRRRFGSTSSERAPNGGCRVLVEGGIVAGMIDEDVAIAVCAILSRGWLTY